MATISNTPRPGYVWDSTDNVWYPIGVGGHAHPDYITQATAVNPTIIDAKGDIITATAADTPARLAVGNNGETLVADSSTSTGLRYQSNFAAGKNQVINGAFNVWQRGTSFTPAVNTQVYSADRFYSQRDGSGTVTVSQQTFTPGAAPVAGYEGSTFYRFNQTVAGSGGTYSVACGQRIEDVRTFAGQTVTLSFWAKADSAWASPVIQIQQNFGSGGSTAVNTSLTPPTYSTSWARYSISVAIPSVSGKTIGTSSFLSVELWGKNNATQTLDIWGVQLEAGSVATAFQTATGTIQGELAACQRYYEQSFPAGTAPSQGASGTVNGVASAYSASDMRTQRFDFKVTKRGTPTMTYYRSNDSATDGRWVYYVNGWTTPTGTSNGLITTDNFNVYLTSSSAFTVRDCYIVEGGGWTASAEL